MNTARVTADHLGPRRKRKRHPNHRLVKIHHSYKVEEIALLFGCHRNTVRDWLKRGLRTIDTCRPFLIHGQDLVAFIRARRLKNKRKCQPGEIYCLRCREPKIPAGNMSDYKPITPTHGNLVGICPTCDAMMYRAVSLAKLEQCRGKLEITLPQELRHLVESSRLSVNRDFNRG